MRIKQTEMAHTDMKRILCFGDSLTWGYEPKEGVRLDSDSRWTGVLNSLTGDECIVIEEGQNGRTIATDDPEEGEKNGMLYLVPCLESQSPLDVMVLMLGTNNLKRKFGYDASDIASEMSRFLQKVIAHNNAKLEGKMKILLVSPPLVGEHIESSRFGESFGFGKSIKVSMELAPLYKELADNYSIAFMDAAKVCTVSETDSIHLDADEQIKLGKAIYAKLKEEYEQ